MLEPRVRLAINTMAVSIARILAEEKPSIYLYGSVTADDFCPGWSDIDLLVLTETPIPAEKAEILVHLRQTLLLRDPDTPQYRLFEGGMLDLRSFLSGEETRAVYWGTTGEGIKTTHDFSPFDRQSLLQTGQLLLGRDVRRHIDMPSPEELDEAAWQAIDAIYRHGRGSRDKYAFGWLLDLSRAYHQLILHRPATKSQAARWMLDFGACPCPSELAMALTVRRQPEMMDDPAMQDYAEGLSPAIGQYLLLARVLRADL